MSNEELFAEAGKRAMPNPPALNTDGRDKREEIVHTDLARRLKNVCGGLGAADFEALLTQMTSEQLRGERYRSR